MTKNKVEIINDIPTVTYRPWISWYLGVPVLRDICKWFIERKMRKIETGESIRGYIGMPPTIKMIMTKKDLDSPPEQKHGAP